jgi:hypothetical protein
MATRARRTSRAVAQDRAAIEESARSLLSKLLQTIAEHGASAENIVFFPAGIQLIDVKITIAGNTVNLTVRGDKTASGGVAAEE